MLGGSLTDMSAFVMTKSVEYSNTEVKIGGEGYPNNIGQKQEDGSPIYLVEEDGCSYNQGEEEQNPHKGEIIEVKVEEEDAPKEVEYKLKAVVFQCPCLVLKTCAAHDNKI